LMITVFQLLSTLIFVNNIFGLIHNTETKIKREVLRFTRSVKQWLNVDPDNVVAVHCMGGKGET
jgi:hypothetical protein